jgi:oligopeptide/dipeptide ABC transporter ATP-binding protein
MSAAPVPVLAIDRLRLAYRTPQGLLHAVRDATLTAGAGESVGLVGESGSGKSSLARAALGLLPQRLARIQGGCVSIAGRDVTAATETEWETLRGNPVAMVFQDPLTYLNPVMRVGRQIAEGIKRHDRRAKVTPRVAELLALVRLPASAARAYPHELSGGMCQRALLAVALGCRPNLLIADEPTTALDVTTQAEILALLRELRERLGTALLLISHDLGVVASACERLYVMYAGRIVEWGPTEQVFRDPWHPYTSGLLRAARVERNQNRRFATIEGDVPNLIETTLGCPFAGRCPHTMPRCREEMPPAFPVAPKAPRAARCWRLE